MEFPRPCNRVFATIEDLHNHVKDHTCTLVPSRTPNRTFICRWEGCEKDAPFGTKNHLDRHMQNHTRCKYLNEENIMDRDAHFQTSQAVCLQYLRPPLRYSTTIKQPLDDTLTRKEVQVRLSRLRQSLRCQDRSVDSQAHPYQREALLMPLVW